MPIFDHRYLDTKKDPLPKALQDVGAILPAEVAIPKALSDLLTAKKAINSSRHTRCRAY